METTHIEIGATDEYVGPGPSKGARIFSFILKLPLILLVLISWVASFYVAYAKIQNYSAFIIYTVTIVLYIAGILAKRN